MNFTYTPNQIALFDSEHRLLAQVTYPDIDESTVNIDHTFVDESLRGKGVAGQLMDAVAEDLRSHQKKAVLSCSYAVKWFASHSEYGDVVK